MKDKIQVLLDKDLEDIEFTLKNGDSLSMRNPNSGNQHTIEIEDEKNLIKWVQVFDDGCTYENYINIDDISFVTGIYNCPALLEDEEIIEEEVDEDA